MTRTRRNGCLAHPVLLLVIVAIIVLFAVGIKQCGVVPAPRADTAAFATQHTAAILRIDLVALGNLGRRFAALPLAPRAFLKLVAPYECSVMLDVDSERGIRRITAAASPDRFGTLLLWMTKNRPLPTPSGGFQWTTPGLALERGALTLRGEQNISQATLDTARKRWNTKDTQAAQLEGGHFLEAVASNRNGEGFLAFAGLFLPETTAESQAPHPQELQQIFDAKELSSLFYRARTARLLADVDGPNAYRISAEIECLDETAARSAEFALMTVMDLAFRNLLEIGVTLEGDTALEGNRVRAEYTLQGIETALKEAFEAAQLEKPDKPKESTQ